MLVLSRKIDEWVILFVGDTEIARLKCQEVKSRNDIKLCFDAPKHVRIVREECIKGVKDGKRAE